MADNTSKKSFIKLYMAALAFIAMIFIAFLCISYGNPQAHKYVYMWQAYIWPAKTDKNFKILSFAPEKPKVFFSSSNYTGTWRTWYRDGQLETEKELVNGEYHGFNRDYSKSGQLRSEINYKYFC